MMQCAACKTMNDADAVFCTACGAPLAGPPRKTRLQQRKAYLIALLFVPVILVAAGFGYYKFILPDGVAAVVNGETIKLSEVDEELSRTKGTPGTPSGRVRYQVLNRMIAERIMLQEARRAGISVSKREIVAAVDDARAASGLDETAFGKDISSQYGSISAFEDSLSRHLLINKYLADKVVPAGADPQAAQAAVNRWFEGVSGKASVRIALVEQGAGTGCGCCNKEDGQSQQRQGMPGRGCAASRKPPAGERTLAAADAGLRYWRTKHGPDDVTTRLTDFGCHIRIDIVKKEKIIGALRYQDGSITEL